MSRNPGLCLEYPAADADRCPAGGVAVHANADAAGCRSAPLNGLHMTKRNGTPANDTPVGAVVGGECRDVADDAPAILWVTDTVGFCTYLNRKWYSFTGQTPAEALGYGWTSAVHPEDQERTTRTFLDALDRVEPFQLDYRLRRADGEYRNAVDIASPRFDATGAFIGYVGCVLDITERKQLERRLLHSQKMEAVGRLAAGIAHDFNNLLTTIAGHAQLISDESSKERRRDDLLEIEHAVERASALTRQLLTFSRQQMLNPRPLDLNGAVRAAGRMFSRVIGEDIELRIELSEQLPLIRADPAQIDQVVLNLVLNARDAMARGGVLSITTRSCHGRESGRDASVALVVADTGVGMDEATKRRLFEPFFTTKPEGTGLGLATVYGIVKQSGGDIAVSSEPGRGTSVTVVLPVTRDTAVDEPSPIAGEARKGSGTILVVEDEVALREVVVRTLKRQGYNVLKAAAVTEGLQKLEEHQDIRLLITDLVMPDGTGFDLAQIVKTHPNRPHVLFMSGYSGNEMARRGIESGEYPFLQKPFTPTQLALVVSDILAGRESS